MRNTVGNRVLNARPGLPALVTAPAVIATSVIITTPAIVVSTPTIVVTATPVIVTAVRVTLPVGAAIFLAAVFRAVVVELRVAVAVARLAFSSAG